MMNVKAEAIQCKERKVDTYKGKQVNVEGFCKKRCFACLVKERRNLKLRERRNKGRCALRASFSFLFFFLNNLYKFLGNKLLPSHISMTCNLFYYYTIHM